MSDLTIKLPNVCARGFMIGKLVPVADPTPDHAADAICVECNVPRIQVSETTFKTLTAITQKFGAPREPIVFRSPQSVMKKFQQQDAHLSRCYTADARSHFQIITDAFDENAVDDEPPLALRYFLGTIYDDYCEMGSCAVVLPPGTPQDVADRVASTLRTSGTDKETFYALLAPGVRCCVCQRPLKDETSKPLGIGPECAGRMGLQHNTEMASKVLARRRELGLTND